MSYDVVTTTLGSAVADAGTFVVDYPAGGNAGVYGGGYDHKINSMGYGELSAVGGDISVSLGATQATITNNSGQTLAAGTVVNVQLDRGGPDMDLLAGGGVANPMSMAVMCPVLVTLGAPATADANGVVESQAATSADGLATGINGALASGGVATFDVPRNVVAAWTTTAVLTVTGTDEYGVTIVESSASGTSLAGKKAFKTVTGISVSANVTGLTVGTGDVLGLPAFLAETGHVIAEYQDGADASAGTVVAGVTATATATTGDVRGTYDPSAAANGSRLFQLLCIFDDPAGKGAAQFGG